MKKYILPIILILFCFILYINSLSNGFAYDDRYVIVKNTSLKYFKDCLPYFFNEKYFSISNEQTYRPIATLSYFACYSFWKLNPAGYHLLSLLLHMANVLLLFILLSKLSGKRILSFAVCLIYLSHPVLTEAIDCISFNEDLLTTLFFILSFLFYIKFKKDNKKQYINYLLSLLFFSISLLSKEMGITLFLNIIFYDLFIDRGFKAGISKKKETSFNNFVIEILNKIKINTIYYIGYIIVAVFYLYLIFAVFKNPSKSPFAYHGNLLTRIIYLPYDFFLFLKLSFFPLNLNADYIFSYPASFFGLINIMAYLALAFIIAYSIYIYKYSRIITFGIWWFIITLLPVMNIIELYQPLAERFLYLPLIGFAIVAGALFTEIPDMINIQSVKIKQGLKIALISFLVIFYSINTISRNPVWKNDFTLWSDVIKKSPDSESANNNLGALYYINGNLGAAEKYYKKAIELNPGHSTYRVNLGQLYLKQGSYDNAITELNNALKLDPSYYQACYYLGASYEKKGMFSEAEIQYKKVIDLNPYYYDAYNSLGSLYTAQKMYSKAGELFSKAITLNPGNLNFYFQLANVFFEQKNYNDAIYQWKNILAIDPANRQAKNNIVSAEKLLKAK